ncbi:MAG TPA: hypothetical protein VFT17_05420, partial [Propionibacteriaceae bacterium]|nr:hypothetical protein [Propionibacteriaceae bacterium]
MDTARAASRACHGGWLTRCRIVRYCTPTTSPWHHGVFSWDELLINDVLPALRSRRALQYRPPAWVSRGREGAIVIENDRDFVIIEGVGSSKKA